MCGIAGILERRGQHANEALLLGMAWELRHRGPDGVGLYVDGSFGMVNTRLAIVDLAGGDQPLTNEDGRYWVMQNGEIYNAPELREMLGAMGHTFRTHCDTEVLVHAYEAWGAQSLDRLNGAFAFAIWDRLEQSLFLARDRFGIRPLFLAEHAGAFAFASEKKALLRDPRIPRAIDPVALAETLTFWAHGPERSSMTGIRELPPGAYLQIGLDLHKREKVWWAPAFAASEAYRDESEERLALELLELLEDATRLRLRADVPVGAYLSGGLDSSATAAIARRQTSQPLRAFGLQFTDQRFDERGHQEAMARALGVDLERVEVDERTLAEAFPAAVRMAEQPMLRTAPAPLALLSKRARDAGFKVVLTGEGADEVFAGYNIFKEDKVRRFWARQPQSKLRPRLLERLYPYLVTDLAQTGAFQRAFFGRSLEDGMDPLYSHRIRAANGHRLVRLLSPAALAQVRAERSPEERLIARLPQGFENLTPLSRAQYLEIRTFLQGYILHSQGDRMLMMSSVEGRFPFLDHRLFELAARLPDRLRLRCLEEKYLLKRAVAPLLPPDTVRRQKQPYRAPILRVFVGPGAPPWVDELLSASALAEAGCFDTKKVARLKDKCVARAELGVSETDEMALVAVLSTMLLHDLFVRTPPSCAISAPKRIIRGTVATSEGVRA